MLPSSVRRVASTAPQSPILSGLASTVPRATTALGLPYRPNRHQRRCSSSKPSSPDNGPKDIPAAPAPAQSRSSEAKSSGEKRKRRAKDASDKNKLPSVPSTQHLPQESLALSTFFSLHRPMSVTHSLPKAITEDAFASIFVPRTRGQKTSDIISTLSRTVDELEQPMSKLALGGQHEMEGDNMHKIDFKHPDGSESSVYVQLNAMSGQFLPFRPPPLPEPETANAEAAAEAGIEEVVDEATSHHRVYKAVFTIEETTDTDGQIKVMAHSPQLIEEQAEPRSFLERMAQRQLRFEESREHRHQYGTTMLALSVLRRRKLKMKKKKYKKLLKRTRNERRKLDRN